MHVQEITAPPEETPADVLVLFQFADQPAPRGRLGRLDWILLSALSRLHARGKFAGERGSSVLLASAGKLKADWVLVMGLGSRADLTLTALYRLSYQAAEALLKLRCDRIVVELPWWAFPGEPPARIQRAFLEGFVAELQRGRPEAAFNLGVLLPGDVDPERGRGASGTSPRKGRRR